MKVQAKHTFLLEQKHSPDTYQMCRPTKQRIKRNRSTNGLMHRRIPCINSMRFHFKRIEKYFAYFFFVFQELHTQMKNMFWKRRKRWKSKLGRKIGKFYSNYVDQKMILNAEQSKSPGVLYFTRLFTLCFQVKSMDLLKHDRFQFAHLLKSSLCVVNTSTQ